MTLIDSNPNPSGTTPARLAPGGSDLSLDFGYFNTGCPDGPIGGVDLGGLAHYLFVFTNGSVDANWQGATKGFVGDVVVNGLSASERTSGGVPYAGTISTNDSTLGAWQGIVNQNPGQAFASTGQTALVSSLTAQPGRVVPADQRPDGDARVH